PRRPGATLLPYTTLFRSALDLSGRGVTEHDTGDQRGEVGVENGRQRLFIAEADGGGEVCLAVEFFADSLEDQHVGVDCHADGQRSEEHTSELQSRENLVC